MYDGKQVLRLETKFKNKDLYNIGIEMKDRKGTGNYDKERTKFNVEYVSISERNMYQEVKQTLNNRNIEYLNKPNTNLLNGITFTSGPEFFETLGMKFIETDRTYKTGNKKGQVIKVPDIKSKEDIPQAVSFYFDSCMDFLKGYVGEENIVLAQIHYDEDTPHLQAYFLPVVDSVKRKCYEKDSNGDVVKEEYTNRNGVVSLVPKLLRDNEGKIIYETKTGKFLNNDQFWKDKGGKNSFTMIQNSFNKFITERGFKLDRGEIGANKVHQTKLEYDIAEKKAELEELNREKENIKEVIKDSKTALKTANNLVNKEALNPTKKKVIGYKDEDIDNLVLYSKNLEKINTLQETEIRTNKKTIEKLTLDNNNYKNNSELVKRNKIIKEQKETISKQQNEISRLNNLVEILNNNIDKLKYTIETIKEQWKERFSKLGMAIDKLLGRETNKDLNEYDNLADSINYDYYDSYEKKIESEKDDFDISI